MSAFLTHPRVTEIYELGVFNGVSSIEDMCKAIFKHSLNEEEIDTNIFPDADPKENQKVFRGDAFEVFGEYLCRVTDKDTRIGVLAGEVVPLDEDVGVDLHGISTQDMVSPVAVQFKFKSDPSHRFQLKELATWLAASGHIFKANGRNLILITTGKEVNHKVLQVVPNLRVINRDLLKLIADNNDGFWRDFLKSLELSATKPKERSSRVLRGYQEESVAAIEGWL